MRRSLKVLHQALLPGREQRASRHGGVGAYDPPSGRDVHMNPEEALQAFQDLGAKQMVPMHYGSFRLSFEPPEEPLERLLTAAKKRGIEDRISVMIEGQPLVF